VHLFGLTGGIASGKSAAAARLRARGVPVIDADRLAREVVADKDVEDLIRATFGAAVFRPTGELDRKALATVAFADENMRKRLNAITHPRITALTVARAEELRARGEPLGCYEAALIVENAVADAFRPLVLIAAPERLQVERASARDGAGEAETLARIRAQTPLSEKVKVADFVIDNTGTLDELDDKVDAVLVSICHRFGIEPSRYPLPQRRPA
jgi:dephospho-CoA kinase